MDISKLNSPGPKTNAEQSPVAKPEQKKYTPVSVDTIEHFARRPSGGAVSIIPQKSPPAPLLSKEKIAQVEDFRLATTSELLASRAQRLEDLQSAQKQTDGLGKIIRPLPVSNKPRPSIYSEATQVAWVKQLSRTKMSSASGVAGEAFITILEDISSSKDRVVSNQVSYPVTKEQKDRARDAIRLLNETLHWEHELEGFMDVKMAQKPDSGIKDVLSLYKNHVALNICQSLKVHKKVLIPVNFYAVTGNYDVAGCGHASLLLIEESASSGSYDMHYFETDGKRGGKFNLADVQKKAGPDRHWSDLVAVEREFESMQNTELASADIGLRFSRFSVTGIEKHKINPDSILPFLAPLKIVDRQFDTLDQVRSNLAGERKVMLDNIFEKISSFGTIKLLPQQLQLCQVSGECEMAAYSALLTHVLKDKQNNLSNITLKMVNDLGANLAEKIISQYSAEVSKVMSDASKEISILKKTMKDGMKSGNNEKWAKIKKLQDEADEEAMLKKNDIMALKRAIAGLKNVDTLMKVPEQGLREPLASVSTVTL